MKKASFFSRITGRDTDDNNYYDDTPAPISHTGDDTFRRIRPGDTNEYAHDDHADDETGELAVDIYQTTDAIVVKAFVAGVQPTTLDIALTREMVTVTGTRTDEREVEEDDFFQRELYWGSFSRTILLPEEVDVDLAEASEKNGVLIIRLPKVNKKRQTKLKVKSR